MFVVVVAVVAVKVASLSIVIYFNVALIFIFIAIFSLFFFFSDDATSGIYILQNYVQVLHIFFLLFSFSLHTLYVHL